VKLDRSFVRELTASDEGDAIAHALIDVCHALHAEVIAVGIETAGQAARLRELGCDFGQGDYFSQPLPPDEMEGLLKRGAPRRCWERTQPARSATGTRSRVMPLCRTSAPHGPRDLHELIGAVAGRELEVGIDRRRAMVSA
jgi:hypothetical protein